MSDPGRPQTASGAHVLGSDPGPDAARPDVSDVSVGQAVGNVLDGVTTLVHQEIELAKAEVRSEAKRAAKGVGMLVAAGLAGFFLLLFLSLWLMFAIENLLGGIAWAALVVTLLWGVAAAVLASRGRRELSQVNPKPEQTVQSLKEDVQWAKNPRT